MATTTSTTSSIGQLDPYFTNIINNLMTIERQPITRLTQQKDDLQVRKAVYTDVKTQLDALQTRVRALLSSESSYSLTAGRGVSVAPSSGTVVTATVSSSAVAGVYNLDNILLARRQVARSDKQTYSDQMLGLQGSFVIGGEATRSVTPSTPSTGTVAEITTGNVATGQTELGSNTYYVETRQYEGEWQFRLVDSEGTAISVQQGSTEEYGTGWQEIPTDGAYYDTGRGLKVKFGTDSGAFGTYDREDGGVASGAYKAKGATITVSSTYSLNDIASKINAATYANGNAVQATVVNGQMVLQTALTGAVRSISAKDVIEAGKDNVLQTLGVLNVDNTTYKNYTAGTDASRDASFTVNGLSVTRSQSTGITNVVTGLTMNLASDAEGKTAAVTVTSNTTSARTAVNAFISQFNATQDYLQAKTSVTKNANGTYSRGSLSGDFIFRTLSMEMLSLVNRNTSNSGQYKNLQEIGIALDTDMTLVVTDSTKLDNAMQNNMSDVQALMDGVMGGLNTKLGTYTGSSGYVALEIDSTEDEMESVGTRITDMEARMTLRQQQLTDQYAQVQTLLLTMTYQQQMMSSIYSTYSSSA